MAFVMKYRIKIYIIKEKNDFKEENCYEENYQW